MPTLIGMSWTITSVLMISTELMLSPSSVAGSASTRISGVSTTLSRAMMIMIPTA